MESRIIFLSWKIPVIFIKNHPRFFTLLYYNIIINYNIRYKTLSKNNKNNCYFHWSLFSVISNHWLTVLCFHFVTSLSHSFPWNRVSYLIFVAIFLPFTNNNICIIPLTYDRLLTLLTVAFVNLLYYRSVGRFECNTAEIEQYRTRGMIILTYSLIYQVSN